MTALAYYAQAAPLASMPVLLDAWLETIDVEEAENKMSEGCN